jgi:hypothetical protein
MMVFLLWMNDAVLDVYATLELAESAALMVRQQNRTGHAFKDHWTGESPRWYQPSGPVARLEIETREVQTSPPPPPPKSAWSRELIAAAERFGTTPGELEAQFHEWVRKREASR